MLAHIKLLAVILLFAAIPHLVQAEGEHMVVLKKQGSFAEVKEAVEIAIEGHGLVINNVSHIGDMLKRTGNDLGGAKLVYMHAEALEFCSAMVSRRMMESDPDNIVFCPYIIAIYVQPDKPNEVKVAYRKTQMVGSPESRKALKAVNDLLAEIAQEAVQ